MPILNGRRVDGPTAPFDLSDRGLLLGDGLFDTLVAFGGHAWRGEAHLERLAAGAAQLAIPVARATLEETLAAVLAEAPAAATVRLTLTRGPGPRGLKPPDAPTPTLLATAAPWSPAIVFRPVRLALAEARRNDRSPTSRLKTLGYLDPVLATAAAAARGFDDALFLDTADRVACATMANVFAVHGRVLTTPPVSDGILPGVARAAVLEAAPALGLAPREASLALADLAEADEVFLTNSVRLVLPVTAIEDRPVPGAARSPVARAVLAALLDDIRRATGADPGVSLAD
ncbi:aminotransferase class IV [Prosthecomicrobium sp. N25]|uniref:aminotransferase class IV n=1 Tax=Prosthecomicrobium sp. N25 TaxID=3129254 RepID=UPI003076E694